MTKILGITVKLSETPGSARGVQDGFHEGINRVLKELCYTDKEVLKNSRERG